MMTTRTYAQPIKVAAIVAAFLLCSTGPALAQDQHWGYVGDTAPANWGKDYPVCASGVNQSPVNVGDAVNADLAPIELNYNATPLHIIHNGHTIEGEYSAGSTLTIQGHTYELKQFHFHSPGENHIKGSSYPMEAHLVHVDKDGNLAVLAVLFTEGQSNPFIESVWELMPTNAGSEQSGPTRLIDVTELLPYDKSYYFFNGSLTTPPCSEGVRWLVMKDSVQISRAQIQRFKSAVGFDNNRPVQLLNARIVLE